MEQGIQEQPGTALRFLDHTDVLAKGFVASCSVCQLSLDCSCITGLLPALSQSYLSHFHFLLPVWSGKNKPKSVVENVLVLLYLKYLCVSIKESRVQLYFTELFWTSTTFCVHAVSTPPLMFLRVNCMGMTTCFWIWYFFEVMESPWARSSGVFLFHNIWQHMKQVLFC